MPPWGLAKKSFKFFVNFSFGQFFSQPLEDDQILITSDSVGCKNIYLNKDKLNAILLEGGIPLVICVAYISEIIIRFPWSVELSGIDFVVQAISGSTAPTGTDELFQSMISSMSTAAFAAARAVDTTTAGVGRFSEDLDCSDSETEEQDANVEEKTKGFGYQAYQFLENLMNITNNINIETKDASSFVDKGSQERIAHMIDSLIAQTSVILRDVSLRVECQLKLPGLHRASGLTLSIRQLSVSNQYNKTEEKTISQQQTISACTANNTDGGIWSWLSGWWRSPQSTSSSDNSSVSVAASAGTLSTMLHKIVHLEDLNLFWDLWDTSDTYQSQLGLSTSFESDVDSSPSNKFKTSGPTADSMVASAKLLTLSGHDHTARLSLRVGSLKSMTDSISSQLMEPSHSRSRQCTPTSDAPVQSPSSATTVPSTSVSDFQLRLHLDLGPVIACACPSQFYWIHMMLGQLVQIYDDYTQQNDIDAVNHRLETRQEKLPTDLMLTNQLTTCGTSSCTHSPEHNPTSHSSNFSLTEPQLIDLNLSNDVSKPENLKSYTSGNSNTIASSQMLTSELFCSCMTDMSEDSEAQQFNDYQRYPNQQTINLPSQIINNDVNVDTKFSLAANVLCIAFIMFYEDQSALRSNSFERNQSRNDPIRTKLYQCTELNLNSSENLSDFDMDTNTPRSLTPQPSQKSDNITTSEPISSNKSDPVFGNVNFRAPTAALPGPYIFFSRFHGHSSSCCADGLVTAQISHAKDLKRQPNITPMVISRSDVDTGRMTPSEWVSSLSKQFSNLASPRDHLWYVDLGIFAL